MESQHRKRHHPPLLTRRHLVTGTAGLGLAAVLGTSFVSTETTPRASAQATPTFSSGQINWDASLDRLRATLPMTAELLGSVDPQDGGQLYVSLMGQRIADYAFGTTGTGTAITPDSLVPWASATKPTTCLAIMRLADAQRLSIDEPVTTYIPEFEVDGKDSVLIRHLLTHTGHLGGYGGPTKVESFDETVDKIIRAPLEESRPGMGRSTRNRQSSATAVATPIPGTDPSYNPAGIWILGEILRRVHNGPFDQVIRSEIFVPMGMTDSWNGMSDDQFRAYGGRIVSGAGRIDALQVRAETASQSNPAGGGVGPIRELARVYEMMLAGGTIDGTLIIAPQTASGMTKVEATDGGIWTWGLGLNLNVNGPTSTTNLGAASPGADDPVEQISRYGRRASPQAFGHPGATGTIAFADAVYGLVFTAIGLPTSVADAVYDDLELQ